LDSEPIIKPTKDGSSTLYSPGFAQHYHNPNGAVAESLYIFFESTGLQESIRQHRSLNIFETGFGTGMNLVLLLDALESQKSHEALSLESHKSPDFREPFESHDALESPDAYEPLDTRESLDAPDAIEPFESHDALESPHSSEPLDAREPLDASKPLDAHEPHEPHEPHEKVSYSGAITYLTVEAYPIAVETVSKLQFGTDSDLERFKPLLEKIFRDSKPGMNRFELSSGLTLLLYIGQFEQLFKDETISEKFQIIFHDPFSPEVNAELWTPDVFQKLKSISSPDALLSTYCAASSARAAMAVAGWFVAKNRGALGKREMTLASTDADRLAGWKRVNEKRLVERYRNGEF